MHYNAPGAGCRCCGDVRVNHVRLYVRAMCLRSYIKKLSPAVKFQDDAVKNRPDIDQDYSVTATVL